MYTLTIQILRYSPNDNCLAAD